MTLGLPITLLLLSLTIGVVAAQRADTVNQKVTFSQVIHRHGARTPFIPGSGNHCADLGCGTLNEAGKSMLQAVGEWARIRYINGTDLQTTYMGKQSGMKSSGYSNYSARYVSSRSTDTARTIQSADSFLRGFFPDLAYFYPVIATGPEVLSEDSLLRVDALPAFQVPYALQKSRWLRELDPAIGKMDVFDNDTVQAIAKELDLETVCPRSSGAWQTSSLAHCLLMAQDVAASFNVTGRLQSYNNGGGGSSYPVSMSLLPHLMQVRRLWNTKLFQFNASDPLDVKRGSLGQDLAQQLVATMKKAAGGDPDAVIVFKEWSTHASTLMSLAATLGVNDLMLPLFGEAFFFELLEDTSRSSSSSSQPKKLFVRGVYGHPTQEPGSGHVFPSTPTVFPLNCIGASGETYTLTQSRESCPLEDWHRFITASLPEDPKGSCYVEPALFEGSLDDGGAECSPTNSLAPEPGSLCAYFRQRCPQWACLGAAVLTLGDLRCVNAVDLGANRRGETRNEVDCGTGVLTSLFVGVILFCVLAAVGGIVFLILKLNAARKNGKTRTAPDPETRKAGSGDQELRGGE